MDKLRHCETVEPATRPNRGYVMYRARGLLMCDSLHQRKGDAVRISYSV